MLAVCIVTAFVYQMGKRIFAKSLDINQNTIEKAQNCKIPGRITLFPVFDYNISESNMNLF